MKLHQLREVLDQIEPSIGDCDLILTVSGVDCKVWRSNSKAYRDIDYIATWTEEKGLELDNADT